ncbi:MAG: nitrous oxide-stimulated promoter family protein [Candidatus Thorarchaeota archaeon]
MRIVTEIVHYSAERCISVVLVDAIQTSMPQLLYHMDDKTSGLEESLTKEMTTTNDGPRISREKRTVEKMIQYYCERKHRSDSGSLCEECASLKEYSIERLNHCQFGEEKPTCRKCTVHCYRPMMREEIRRVMRFSGPRLAIRMPLEWIRHAFDERE